MRPLQWCCTVVLAVTISAGCSTVPGTGRSRLNFISDRDLLAMSREQYAAYLKEAKISRDARGSAMVDRVGHRIAAAVEEWLAEHGEGGRAFEWEFTLVANKQANAWAMPGGKVVVYEGILDIARDDNGLATVLGHEIAHVVARHGAERMSDMLLVQLGGMALGRAMHDKPEKTRALWMTAFGLGAQFGAMLPYSRLHESEADQLGLLFMATAGYDPRSAVDFWQRMEEAGSARPPELLSTHPAPNRRIENIKAHLPEAMAIYEAKVR